jgi:hypothetical protein
MKFAKTLGIIYWVSLTILWLFLAWVVISNKIRIKHEKVGYLRGMAHAQNYFKQFGAFPKYDWIETYWQYINTENGWIPQPNRANNDPLNRDIQYGLEE